MLAKQAATVDEISGGRLVLGIGAGWNEREYRAFGFPFDNRVSRFEEAFTIIRTLLRNGSIDFAGTYHTAERCVLHPRSSTPGGPPLMVGSASPRMMAITLPYVHGWNIWWSLFGNTSDGFAATKTRVDARLLEIGRRVGDVEATCAVYVQLGEGTGRVMGDTKTAAPIRGTAAEIADQLRAFANAGADHVQLVVDPITRGSIESLGEMLAELDRTSTHSFPSPGSERPFRQAPSRSSRRSRSKRSETNQPMGYRQAFTRINERNSAFAPWLDYDHNHRRYRAHPWSPTHQPPSVTNRMAQPRGPTPQLTPEHGSLWFGPTRWSP